MNDRVSRTRSRGPVQVGEGTLCWDALNFGPRKHMALCTLKSQIVSTALKTPEPPMGGGEEAGV